MGELQSSRPSSHFCWQQRWHRLAPPGGDPCRSSSTACCWESRVTMRRQPGGQPGGQVGARSLCGRLSRWSAEVARASATAGEASAPLGMGMGMGLRLGLLLMRVPGSRTSHIVGRQTSLIYSRYKRQETREGGRKIPRHLPYLLLL